MNRLRSGFKRFGGIPLTSGDSIRASALVVGKRKTWTVTLFLYRCSAEQNPCWMNCLNILEWLNNRMIGESYILLHFFRGCMKNTFTVIIYFLYRSFSMFSETHVSNNYVIFKLFGASRCFKDHILFLQFSILWWIVGYIYNESM